MSPVERTSVAAPADPWRITPLHVRAVIGGLLVAFLAVILRRPDLVVLATPLLAVALWGLLTRPAGRPSNQIISSDTDLVEDRPVRIRVRTAGADGAETIGHELGAGPGLLMRPDGWADVIGGAEYDAVLSVRPIRWGSTYIGMSETRLRSPWGAFDSAWKQAAPIRLHVAPTPGVFAADAPVPDPSLLLGLHGGRHRGDGSEFDDIREYRPGDRPRRIHWRTSARTGRLHVRTTYADNDTEVVLLVDAFGNLPGSPDGSLTRTVRAAASIAAWCTRNGDRVGLRVLGAAVRPVVSGTGRAQLLRILGALARITPANDRFPDAARLRLRLAPGSLLVVLTPLTEARVIGAARECAAAGLDVLVIDTAPETVLAGDLDLLERLAWRALELERSRTTSALARSGVSVSPWRGPGTLDAVLTAMSARRARVP